jgi:hypothetical protein
VNELRMHNPALLSLLLIENLIFPCQHGRIATNDPILVPPCIAQRHISPVLLTILIVNRLTILIVNRLTILIVNRLTILIVNS